jgi:DNA-binding IclR family transcriptional regulator
VTQPVRQTDDYRCQQAPRSGSVAYAMAVLRLLAHSGKAFGVNALARELGMAPSTCFKILKALQADDFVQTDGQSKEYVLGSGAISIAMRALDPLRSFSIVRPRLQALAVKYSLAVGLWRLPTASGMTLAGFAENNNTMRIHMSVGQRLPALVGAIGRVVAARLNLPDDDLQIRFDKLRWQAPLSFAEYREQVRLASQLGYGHDSGYFLIGVESVGVAIADGDGNTGYGISGSMFSGQHTRDTVALIGQELKEIGAWAGIRLAR